MVDVRPFRALRPAPGSESRVVSPPYDVVDVEEARAYAGGDPDSFLRVSRPEIDLPADVRGVWFVDAVASWDGGSEPVRTTVGILPERTATGTAAESPFGMAALIAAPERYPDQYPAETVLSMMQRIGVRWVRGGWFPFKDRISAEEERQVRQDIDLLARHGILPHVQLGSGLPKPEELHAFRARLEASLSRFAWVSAPDRPILSRSAPSPP